MPVIFQSLIIKDLAKTYFKIVEGYIKRERRGGGEGL